MPGRPRKWSPVEPRQPYHRQQTRQDHHQQDPDPDIQQSHVSPSIAFTEGSSSVFTCGVTDFAPPPQDWVPHEDDDMGLISYAQFGTPSLLDFSTSAQLDSLPLDSFQACLHNDTHGSDSTELLSSASVTSIAPKQSCDCAKQVFETIRSLKRGPVSHSILGTLRLGADLFAKLLTCPICYDVSKPPRITLQNVLLLGRLSLEVTAGYQKYLKWLKADCNSLAERKTCGKVYLIPGADISSALGFDISSGKLYDLIAHGLQSDAERLSDLGRQFSIRQHNRHLVGHEACPDSEGRCWREKDDVDPDPSDVCPQSAAARALTPCYRIVDEVRSKIQQFEDAVP